MLATVDFDAVRVSVLVVEAWNRECDVDCPKRERVRAMLATAGVGSTCRRCTKARPCRRAATWQALKHAVRARAEARGCCRRPGCWWLQPGCCRLAVAAFASACTWYGGHAIAS